MLFLFDSPVGFMSIIKVLYFCIFGNSIVATNPSSSVFYIQRQEMEAMRISIYDVTGRLIMEVDDIKTAHYGLDLSRFQEGLYFLKIVQGDKKLSTTLLKQ